jgi:hypothetical protein
VNCVLSSTSIDDGWRPRGRIGGEGQIDSSETVFRPTGAHFPDYRIEYEVGGREHHEDTELFTPHYRGAASRAKTGCRIYVVASQRFFPEKIAYDRIRFGSFTSGDRSLGRSSPCRPSESPQSNLLWQ